MKTRILFVVSLVILMLAAVTGLVSAASDPATLVRVGKNTGTLAPGTSLWYTFIVPSEYTVQQMKRDTSDDKTVGTQAIRLEFENAWNPNLAHNSGFRIYDPTNYRNAMSGQVIDAKDSNDIWQSISPHWAIGSPEQWNDNNDNDSIDAFLGRTKVWVGQFNEAGVYYIEIYNDSDQPLNYTLIVSGWNSTLMPA